MHSERLLERIRRMEREPESRFRDETPRERIRSIGGYLETLLNAREGSSLADPDFGLPDLTDLPNSMSGRKVAEVQRTIQRMVAKYEPRLRKVRVEYAGQSEPGHALQFTLSGELADDDGREPAVFHADVGGDGSVRLWT